ncbi:MAG: hypothetical protein COA58_13575 [Bacteroidetes bacterium]|nr:MAG: hypothetical protein COA58_13575 [Bacteroidota bacterium]
MKTLFLLFSILGSLISQAQLAGVYGLSAYSKVKHPYDQYKNRGVISVKNYIYNSGSNSSEFYRFFEKPKRDSFLIFSYLEDTINNKIIINDFISSDEQIYKEYTINKFGMISRLVYVEMESKKLIDTNSAKNLHRSETTYDYSNSGVLRSSTIQIFKPTLKAKFFNKKQVLFDTFILSNKTYNESGFVLTHNYSSQNGILNYDKSFSKKRFYYNSRNYLDSLVGVDSLIYYYHPTKKRRFRTPSIDSITFTTNHNHSFIRDNSNKIKIEKCSVDSHHFPNLTHTYTNFGKPSRIYVLDTDSDTLFIESRNYDSLERLTQKIEVLKYFTCTNSLHMTSCSGMAKRIHTYRDYSQVNIVYEGSKVITSTLSPTFLDKITTVKETQNMVLKIDMYPSYISKEQIFTSKKNLHEYNKKYYRIDFRGLVLETIEQIENEGNNIERYHYTFKN